MRPAATAAYDGEDDDESSRRDTDIASALRCGEVSLLLLFVCVSLSEMPPDEVVERLSLLLVTPLAVTECATEPDFGARGMGNGK